MCYEYFISPSQEKHFNLLTLPQGKVFQENVTCYTAIADQKKKKIILDP